MPPSHLRELADGLWCIDHRDFSVGGLRIGTRSTVVRLSDGTLLLHSPGPLGTTGFAAIRELGTVSHVVAANRMHDLFYGAATAEFPQACGLAPRSVREAKPNVRVDEALGDRVPASLAQDFELMQLQGAPKLDEHLLFHAATRTLLAVDVAFNIRNATGFTRFAMWLNDGNDKFGMTRLGKAQYLSDYAACAASVDRACDAWDIGRIVVGHGEVLESGGREALRRAFDFGRHQ